jgi:hypothetical protein
MKTKIVIALILSALLINACTIMHPDYPWMLTINPVGGDILHYYCKNYDNATRTGKDCVDGLGMSFSEVTLAVTDSAVRRSSGQ